MPPLNSAVNAQNGIAKSQKSAHKPVMSTDDLARLRAFLNRPGVTKRLVTEAAKVGRNALQGVEEDGWECSKRSASLLIRAVDRLEAALA